MISQSKTSFTGLVLLTKLKHLVTFHLKHPVSTATLYLMMAFVFQPISGVHSEEAQAHKRTDPRVLRPGAGVQFPPLPGLHQRPQPRGGHPRHGAQSQRPPEVYGRRARHGTTAQAQRKAPRKTEAEEV